MTEQDTYNMTAIKGLVVEIANESPITSGDNEVNFCRYCERSWTENSWEEYVEVASILIKNPDARDLPKYGLGRLLFRHHDDDCLWVRANKVIRGL